MTADNNIAGNYILDLSNGEITGAGSDKQIILTTKGSGTYADGFKLDNSTSSTTADKIYMFIKPGTHKLKIRYWLKDLVTGTEGTITKAPGSFTYDKNTYYDMTADLDTRAYSGHDYYMWDAQENYWYQHEWDVTNVSDRWQPTLSIQPANPNYPQNKTVDPARWYNDHNPGSGNSYEAQTISFKALPNANEMAWYAMKGDSRWDADELWTVFGHLYKGGRWFKKKTKIAGFTDAHIPNNTSIDLRTQYQYINVHSFNAGLPSASEMEDYFYLPNLAFYISGVLNNFPWRGCYWSSSAEPGTGDNAYSMFFNSLSVSVSRTPRYQGLVAQPFK